MFNIVITDNTCRFLLENSFSTFIINRSNVNIRKQDGAHLMSFIANQDNVKDIYSLIKYIYKSMPEENNRWIVDGEEYPLSDEYAVKEFLYTFEGTHSYPLAHSSLSDVIKSKEIKTIQQVRALAQKPFSGILNFDGKDFNRLLHNYSPTDVPECIETECEDIIIANRYVTNSFNISRGNVDFINCVLDGDIKIRGAAKCHISQCIVTGCITCCDISELYLSSVNAKQILLYNSALSCLRFEYCKFHRFIFHSCTVERFFCDRNRFVEPYIACLSLPEGFRFDMSQFRVKYINSNTVKKINQNKQSKITNADTFFTTFMLSNPIIAKEADEIAHDMVDTLLTYGELATNHHIHSNLVYKKTLYSNNKWRRFFVRLTGAFVIPSRWIVFLIACTVVFTAAYTGLPTMQFTNSLTSESERLDLWSALYFSVCQILGSNLTNFTPIGITQILTTIHSLLDTVFVANFFAALIKKFIRN